MRVGLVFIRGCFSSPVSFLSLLVVEAGQAAPRFGGLDDNDESEGEGSGLESVSLALSPLKVTGL